MSSSEKSALGASLQTRPYLEAIDSYQTLFSRICDKISPVIGEMTLRSILSNMLDFASETYSCFSDVEQEGIHVNFFSLHDTHVPELQQETLEALEFFFDEFISLVGDLTSDFFTEELRKMAMDALSGATH